MLRKQRSIALHPTIARPEISRSPRVDRLMKGSHSAGSEILQVVAILLLYLMIGVGIVVVPIVAFQVMGMAGF